MHLDTVLFFQLKPALKEFNKILANNIITVVGIVPTYITKRKSAYENQNATFC